MALWLKAMLLHMILVHTTFGSSEKQVYVVYMGETTHRDHNVVHARLHSLLSDALGSAEEARENMIHTYKRSFQGFSATLTEQQAADMRQMHGVVSVFPSRSYSLHTTHSWDFLDTVSSFQTSEQNHNWAPADNNGSDIIIGVLDTGIWPESPSFKDDNMSPIPSKWKGICQSGEQFSAANCNKKLIGARFYTAGFDAADPATQKTFIKSARDSIGHGTHTSSTAAGIVVNNVSFPGNIAAGSARGGSPNSRIAMYKVCWDDCKDADVLAAFDDAIADGVDLLSLSLGPDPPQLNYFQESISIGAFHALKKNIFVACSAGNAGLPSTATNLSPWLLTVAASSVDRKFQTNLKLGSTMILEGQSINPSSTKYLPLALGGSLAAPGVPAANASFCGANTLDIVKSKGKIVICHQAAVESRVQKSVEIARAGGAGMVVVDDLTIDVAQTFVLPSTVISVKDGAKLEKYVSSIGYPTAKLLKTETLLSNKPSPTVTIFSSRGPNTVTPDIIKPDITGPGLTILAAWAPIATLQAGNRTVDYNFQTGTSMACPHLAGVAAFLKSKQPSWTPAMIKSAIMTTATTADNTDSLIKNAGRNTVATPFDYGSGHVNLMAAADPGLVYDISYEEYLSFACGIGNAAGIHNLTNQKCPSKTIPTYNLNYPSIGISDLRGSLTIERTLTNVAIPVGRKDSYYHVVVSAPPEVKVQVWPRTLTFNKLYQSQTFHVTFNVVKASEEFVFGSLTWSDGTHSVRSPIAVKPTSLY